MPILKKLEEARIVFFEVSPSGELLIGECCDYYYKTSLTKTEVSQLINELKSLNKQIKNTNTMKNVHLITKEQEGADVLHQYLYITSNEKIKQGDWCIYHSGEVIQYLVKLNTDNLKKIILTDNPDLIAEGVQPIDNEFLEWFVKNPSCERVEVKKGFADGTAWGYNFLDYKIILPQGEPKQEYQSECICENSCRGFVNVKCKQLNKQETLEEPTEEAKQRAENYMRLKGALEPKQETHEEAAERLYPIRLMYFPMKAVDLNEEPRNIFNNGAKFQAERMYSEEDLHNAFYNGWLYRGENYSFPKAKKEWFEQQKKK